MAELYDTIGLGYRDLRRPDSRIAAAILDGLGATSTVVNVGAGAGSYEPMDRPVVAVDPSMTMIRQRPRNAAPAVRATAVDLPFRDASFEIDRRIFPSMEDFRRELGPIEVSEVRVPHDCTDGFLGAYWRRPAPYLDIRVRSAISTLSKLPDVDLGVERLRGDLASREWYRRFGGDVVSESTLDLGYRLVVTV